MRKPYRRPGTPNKYREEYCDAVIESGIKGWTFKEFASSIDVHYDTLRGWMEVHPEFKAAFARAKQEQENYLVKIGRQFGLIGRKTDKNGDTVVPNFNTAVWIFMLKARHGWRENELVAEDGDTELEFIE